MGSGVTYREVTCKSALNRVQGMPFEWSLARAAKEHGAVSFGSRPLKLDPGTREVWFGFVAAQFPELMPRYLGRYRRGPHADPAYIKEVERRVDRVRDLVGFPETRYRTLRAQPNVPVQLALAM